MYPNIGLRRKETIMAKLDFTISSTFYTVNSLQNAQFQRISWSMITLLNFDIVPWKAWIASAARPGYLRQIIGTDQDLLTYFSVFFHISVYILYISLFIASSAAPLASTTLIQWPQAVLSGLSPSCILRRWEPQSLWRRDYRASDVGSGTTCRLAGSR